MKHKQFTTTLTTALCVVGLSGPAAAIDGPVFTAIGDLPGGVFWSSAHAVSGDGNAVVGVGASEIGSEAIRWSWDDGIKGLGALPGGYYYSYAWGVSEDGSVIVGGSYSTSKSEEALPYAGLEAFRWTEEEGMVGLGDLPDGPFGSLARDVSGDGRVVIGAGNYHTAPGEGDYEVGTSEAFLWAEETGMVGLGYLPGGLSQSDAFGVSADGAVVVGYAASTGTSGYARPQAFRWTKSTGMVGLGDLTGEGLGTSFANSVSADGDTVVGQSRTGAATGGTEVEVEAFRWTEATGMVGLGDLPGGAYYSRARAVSGDGAVIVGQSITDIGGEAFVWTESQGMRRLADVLYDDYGLDVGEWLMRTAWDVSDDGLVMVGHGINPEGNQEGWVVCLRDECFEDDDDDDHRGRGHRHHDD